MIVFVLFNSCCINLNYKWNSLLKKIFFILLKHIKNRFEFSIIKNHFLVLKKKKIWYFSNQKTLFPVINTDMNFYLQKPLFSTYYKIDLVFWQIKINFFHQPKQIWFFSKGETSFINKFLWFNFFHMFNISFMTCIKRVHRL